MSRTLVIAPHPDDESIGCGGTLRQHVVDGDPVRVIFLTSGEHGGHGRDPLETAQLRENEAINALSILGIDRPKDPEEEWYRQDDMLVVFGMAIGPEFLDGF